MPIKGYCQSRAIFFTQMISTSPIFCSCVIYKTCCRHLDQEFHFVLYRLIHCKPSREVNKRMSFCQLLDKYTRGFQAKTIQAIDRSKYLKEVILKIKLLYKSLLCIFNFVGPGYFNPLGIRNDLLYILIISDIKYPGPTKLNMQRRDLQSNFILRITSFRYFDLSIA